MSDVQGRFGKVKSLYVEAVGVQEDGTEAIFRGRFDGKPNSELTLSMDNHYLDEPDITGMYMRAVPTREHDFSVAITRVTIGDPTAAVTVPRSVLEQMLAQHSFGCMGCATEVPRPDRCDDPVLRDLIKTCLSPNPPAATS